MEAVKSVPLKSSSVASVAAWAVAYWLLVSAYLWVASEWRHEGLGSPRSLWLSLVPVGVTVLLVGLVIALAKSWWMRTLLGIALFVTNFVFWIIYPAVLARVVMAGKAGGQIDYLSNMALFINDKFVTISLLFAGSYLVLLIALSIRSRGYPTQ